MVIVESMKMEFAVEAPVKSTLRQLFCKEDGGRLCRADIASDSGRLILNELLPFFG